MYVEGETDNLPEQFTKVMVRRLLWQEYGERLPNFTGDDALDAINLHQLEQHRQERDRQKQEQKTRNG